jgi:hypothetical protein
MFGIFRLIKNLVLMKSRLAEDRLGQAREGYLIDINDGGLERYITYFENGRELSILADFTWFNDVVLYTASLRKWTRPYGVELTEYDYQKVLNRVTRYLSCWGEVRFDDSKLPDNDDLKRSLTEQGIEFVESEDGVIRYSVDAEVFREQRKKDQI